MKLQRNNKYNGKAASKIAAVLLASTVLVGCNNNSMDKIDSEIEILTPVETVIPVTIQPSTQEDTLEPIAPDENIEIKPASTSEVIETSDQIIEELTEDNTKEDMIEVLPTNIPVEENNNEKTTKITFKRLTPEEEMLEREKYETPQNANEVYPAYYYFCAGFYVDEKPKLIFGYVDKVSGEEDRFIFMDLCTNEVLFEYRAPIPERYPLTWSGYNNESIEFEAVHPYFANNNIRLRFVDDVIISYNFMDEYSEEDFDRSVIEYFWEIFPRMSDGRLYPATPDEYLTAYLNWVPEPLRITTEELNKAKDEPIKNK